MSSPITKPLGAFHVAHLDLLTGVGMLVCPRGSSDVWFGPESVNGADWNAALRDLSQLGWEPLADDGDLPIQEGATTDGRPVVALFGLDPITSDPSFPEIAAATVALRDLAGVARRA